VSVGDWSKRYAPLVLPIAKTKAGQEAALAECVFFLHGSGPGLVGRFETDIARKAGKPYGFGGITLNDEELFSWRELLAGAKFIFCRDTKSLEALKNTGITGPRMEFGPDATFAIARGNRLARIAIGLTRGTPRLVAAVASRAFPRATARPCIRAAVRRVRCPEIDPR